MAADTMVARAGEGPVIGIDSDVHERGQVSATNPASARAILTPPLDALSAGGLSLLLIPGFLVYLALGSDGDKVTLSDLVVFSAVFNWPHFMASYKLLYGRADNMKRHPWAAFFVPGLLLVLSALSLAHVDVRIPGFGTPSMHGILVLVSVIYLAWHYTGQAWGMVASFAYLAGIRLRDDERKLIRFGCRALLIFHVLWVLQPSRSNRGFDLPLEIGYWLAIALAILSIPLGVEGFRRIRRRTGQLPLPMLLPWVSLYAWYLFLHLYPDPSTFFWIQLFHAIQYLGFPIRVEMNRRAGRPGATEGSPWLFAWLYFGVLIAAGLLAFGSPMVWVDDANYTASVIATFINIHHYFTDGVAWKLSNPETRRMLFLHLGAEPAEHEPSETSGD